MKLEKAIELLDIAKEGFPSNDCEKYYIALELGIEALKRIQGERKDGFIFGVPLLLGETEK